MEIKDVFRSILKAAPEGYYLDVKSVNKVLEATKLPLITEKEFYDMAVDLEEGLGIKLQFEKTKTNQLTMTKVSQQPQSMNKKYSVTINGITVASENPHDVVSMFASCEEPTFLHYSQADDKFINIEDLQENHLMNIIKNRVSRCKTPEELLYLLLDTPYVAELASRYEEVEN